MRDERIQDWRRARHVLCVRPGKVADAVCSLLEQTELAVAGAGAGADTVKLLQQTRGTQVQP